MSFSVKIPDSEFHIVFYAQPDGAASAYLVEGSAADAKETVPHLQLLTGLSGEWESMRITGEVKQDRRRGASAK